MDPRAPNPDPLPLLRREQRAGAVVVVLVALSLGGLFGALVGRPVLGLWTAGCSGLLLAAPLLSRLSLARLRPLGLHPCPLHPELEGWQLVTRGGRAWVDLACRSELGTLAPRDVHVLLECVGRARAESTVEPRATPDGAVVLRLPLRTTTRGAVHELRTTLASAWPLGLFTERRRFLVPGRLLVLPRPRTHEARALLMRHGLPQGLTRRSEPEGEWRELRGWRPGEGLRHVHWKLSARRGRRVVRVLASGDERELEVVLLRAAPPASRVAFEHAVDLCAGLLEAGVLEGRTVHLSLDGGPPLAHARRREELQALGVLLARVEARDGRTLRGDALRAPATAGVPGRARVLVLVDDPEVAAPEGAGLRLAVDPEGRVRVLAPPPVAEAAR